MFKMLTGQTPPEATAVFDEGLPELPSWVSEKTKQIIKTSMQPRKQERYQNIGDFIKMLDMEQPYVSSVHMENKIDTASEETVLRASVENLGPYFRDENKQQPKASSLGNHLYNNIPKRKISNKKLSDKWNELNNDCLDHFLRKCRYFTFPLGLFFGAYMGFSCSVRLSLFETIMATAFSSIVWGLLIGFMLPWFLYWFTKGYFVKQRLQKIISEEYSWLQDYHLIQLKQQKAKQWNNWVLNSLYFMWPIGMFLIYKLFSVSNVKISEDAIVLSMWALLVISFVVAWIISMVIAVIIKLINI